MGQYTYLVGLLVLVAIMGTAGRLAARGILTTTRALLAQPAPAPVAPTAPRAPVDATPEGRGPTRAPTRPAAP